jgi:hypothetical protein
MDYAKILPHLFAACSLIDVQIKKLDEQEDKLLIADLVEINSVKSTHKKLLQTANHLQLTVAKNNVLESVRLLSVFYGLLYIIRPSITRLIEHYTNNLPCAILVKAIEKDQAIMH